MFEGTISAKLASPLFEKDVFKIVNTHAAIGAFLMMIPDLGFGVFFFMGVLWSMYSKISNKVGLSFRDNFGKLVSVGIVVNIVVAFILDFMLTTFFFLEPFVFYAQFYLSGKFFIESLKKLN